MEERKDRVFTASTLDGREYRRWRQWAKARLMRSKMENWEKGPLLLTFPDGIAAQMFEDLDVEMDLARDGGENVIFERLDERYPQREAEDRMAEVMDNVFELTWNADEDTANFVGRSVQAFAWA